MVRWDAVEGATDYDLNYKPAVGGRWTNWPHRGATALHSTIYTLEPNTQYRWAARAENTDGPSNWVFGPRFTTTEEVEEEDPVVLVEEFTFSFEPQPIENPFNIELEFLPSFYQSGYTEDDKEIIRYAAARWESLLVDVPDWTLGVGWGRGTFACGAETYTQSVSVDDLKIWIGELPRGWNASATGHASITRDGSTSGPGNAVEGCIAIKAGLDRDLLPMIVAHEIGHVLGFGNQFVVYPPYGYLDQNSHRSLRRRPGVFWR